MKERRVEGLTAGRRGTYRGTTPHGWGSPPAAGTTHILLGGGTEPSLTGTPALSKQKDGWTDIRMSE